MATVILVRHGRTTANATGVLAGRTPGVRLDDDRRRAGRAGRRAARGGAAGRGGHEPAGAVPADGAGDPGGRRRAAPSRSRDRARHHRVRLRRVAGPRRSRTWPRSRSGDRADPAVGGGVPRRRVDAGDAGPRGRRRTPPRRRGRGRARPGRRLGRGQPRRHHQVGRWPTPSACTSTCSSASTSTRPRSRSCATPPTRPYVLATNTHAGDLSWLAPRAGRKGRRRPRRSTDAAGRRGLPVPSRLPGAPRVVAWPLVHGFDPPERFVAGTVGPPGSAHVLPPGALRRPGRRASRSRSSRWPPSPSGSTSCSTR